MTMKLTEEAPPLSRKAPGGISAELDRVLAKSLAMDPSYRHRTAGELIHALAVAAAASPSSAVDSATGRGKHTQEMSWMDMIDDEGSVDRPAPHTDTDPRTPTRSGAMLASFDDATERPPRRSGRATVLAAALVLVGVTATGGWLLFRDGGSAPYVRAAEPDDALAADQDQSTPAAPRTVPEQVEQTPATTVTTNPAVEETSEVVPPTTPAATPAAGAGARRTRASRRNGEEPAPSQQAPSETTARTQQVEPPSSRVGEGDVPNIPGRDRPRAQTLEREATSALARGLLPHAIELYRDATQADPSYAPSWRGLGIANERLSRAQDARRAYERYLRLAPSAPDADTIRRRVDGL
jgi:serine/threonine-protein kinase